MKNTLACVCLLLCVSALSSCATTHLWRWGLDKSSAVSEPDNNTVSAFLKPSVTVIGTPFVVAWDILFLPFQLGFGVYPYSDRFMEPSSSEATAAGGGQ